METESTQSILFLFGGNNGELLGLHNSVNAAGKEMRDTQVQRWQKGGMWLHWWGGVTEVIVTVAI